MTQAETLRREQEDGDIEVIELTFETRSPRKLL